MTAYVISAQHRPPESSTVHKVLNILFFQALWWLAVLPAMSQLVWPACVAAGVLFAHTLIISSQRFAHSAIVLVAALIGFIADSALSLSGVVHFDRGFYHETLTSWWMILLWAGFATTLLWSMRFMLNWRWEYLALIGGISGVISYAAGWKLQALAFPHGGLIGLVSIFIVWSLCFPLLCRLTTSFTKRFI
jgi:Protein of unknown function (DUF2878)